jgi:hypothetical protein
MPPKKTKSEKKSTENIIFHEDETDTGTTTEANEPIEVDDDVSHEASEKQCTIVWAIRDGNAPYWRTHHFLMGHIKF